MIPLQSGHTQHDSLRWLKAVFRAELRQKTLMKVCDRRVSQNKKSKDNLVGEKYSNRFEAEIL